MWVRSGYAGHVQVRTHESMSRVGLDWISPDPPEPVKLMGSPRARKLSKAKSLVPSSFTSHNYFFQDLANFGGCVPFAFYIKGFHHRHGRQRTKTTKSEGFYNKNKNSK